MRLPRPATARGRTSLSWLDSRHTFSFGSYHDPAWMGFRGLRVINEDVVAPGQGFGTHPHRDMEIVTLVLSGALAHRDSTGGGGVLGPGEVQAMSAGSGIRHSEHNASGDQPVHFLQIWLAPSQSGLAPRYAQAAVPMASRQGRWAVVAGPSSAAVLPLRAEARVLLADLAVGDGLTHRLPAGRHAWLHVATGGIEVDGAPLVAGDGLGISDEPQVALTARSAATVILFDLA